MVGRGLRWDLRDDGIENLVENYIPVARVASRGELGKRFVKSRVVKRQPETRLKLFVTGKREHLVP